MTAWDGVRRVFIKPCYSKLRKCDQAANLQLTERPLPSYINELHSYKRPLETEQNYLQEATAGMLLKGDRAEIAFILHAY